MTDSDATPTPVSVPDCWTGIETWLAAHNPELRRALRPPVGDADLAALEASVGVELPHAFKESWRIHDGTGDTEGNLIPARDAPGDIHGNATTPGGYYLMPCSEIVYEWKSWKGLADMGEFADRESAGGQKVQRAWWHTGWVPFASNGGGDSICLDLAPGPDGTVGQVITMNHDSAEREVLAPSFARWLADMVELLGRSR
jgi:cell wall assembly regulator SMI1